MVEEGKDARPRSVTTREILEELKGWSGKVFQKVKEDVDTLSAKGKLKLDLTSLKNRRGAEFRKLGMKIYHLLEGEKYRIPEADSNMERIRSLTEEIKEREARIRELGQEPEPAETAPAGDTQKETEEES